MRSADAANAASPVRGARAMRNAALNGENGRGAGTAETRARKPKERYAD
ncbi:hypothetical protein [Treponema endosymbiont of Eucomonympha sp.]|nr:hypothetical protein [Treponema endosymbiont of Eucomonympha sp.]